MNAIIQIVPLLSNTSFSWIFGALVLGILICVYLYIKTKTLIKEYGASPDKSKDVSGTFLLLLMLAALAIFSLKYGFGKGAPAMNMLLFAALPYTSISIFIIGSYYRYKNLGFKVSSLSSQFLEGKQLFWGSQPFHYGLMILFFGHLIAFLFPRSLMAWNSMPIRLLILEVSSFTFGLLALTGLVLLIKRRFLNKRIMVVSNKMDMLVYVVLLTQIISGLGVAFFVRWGSSWFAGVLTPYLRSIFAFNPKIEAVSVMPFWVQLHIISAFFIIAIIPFTRFMHFLVAPIDYVWRNYQLVIWNWNRKTIRDSKSFFPGKKIQNH